MTLVLIRKDLVLEASTTKIEDKHHRFQVYIYIRNPYASKVGFASSTDQSVTVLLLVVHFLFRSKAPKGKSRTSKPCPQMVFGTGDDER